MCVATKIFLAGGEEDATPTGAAGCVELSYKTPEAYG